MGHPSALYDVYPGLPDPVFGRTSTPGRTPRPRARRTRPRFTSGVRINVVDLANPQVGDRFHRDGSSFLELERTMSELRQQVEPAEVGLDPAALRRLDEHFARLVDDGRLPGYL